MLYDPLWLCLSEVMASNVFSSSVSLSDNSLRLSYVLYAIIPVLLLLVVVTAFFCYKRVAKR